MLNQNPRSPDMTSNREFVHSRLIDAPPDLVFARFSNPTTLANWWGPAGFVSTFDTFDFRAGGAWRFVMHGPDGGQYPNECVFREIVPDKRIVIEHMGEHHHFVLTVTFASEWRHGTRVGWRQVFDTAEHRERIAPVVEQANEQNLQRLEATVLMPRKVSPQISAEAAERAAQQFKAKVPVSTLCPSCGMLLSVRYAEYSDVFEVSCPCFACRCSRPGIREHPPTPFFRGDVVMNGHRFAVGMAPRLQGWGLLQLCNFSRPMSLDGRLTYSGPGPHIAFNCSDDEFVAAVVPGRRVVFPLLPDRDGFGTICMHGGYGAVDAGPHERKIKTLELHTSVSGAVARFEFRGHAGPASDVREPDTMLGSGPVDFVAAFECGREELAIFAPNEPVRERLEQQLFGA